MAKIYGLSYRAVHKQVAKLIKLGYINKRIRDRRFSFTLTDMIDWPWNYVNKSAKPIVNATLMVG